MAVPAVGQFGTYTGENNTNAASNTLGKDEFLKLLLTQLKYQNPLEPMEDKDFIAQMASFTTLEQMQNLNTTIADLVASNQLQQAAALIGKKVSYITVNDAGETAAVTGTVKAVTRDSNGLYLNVDGVIITMDQVWSIQQDVPDDTGDTGETGDTGDTGDDQ